MECNWILFLGEFGAPMELNKLKVSTAGFPNTNLSCPEPASKYLSTLYWNGRQRIGWAYWQMAELSPGDVRSMKLNFVRQKRKLIPRHNLITRLSICSKAPVVSCLSCRVDALHGATCSLTPWMSMESFWVYCGFKVLSKGTLLKTSLLPAIRIQLHESGFQ